MNDKQLDDALADLRAELSIEPSPEFAAKVRQQIESVPERRGWSVWTWTSIVATCGIAIVAGALWMRSGGEGVVTPAVTPGVTTANASTQTPAPVATTAQTTSSTPAPSLQQTVNAVRTTRIATAMPPKEKELEVMVPPDQLLAIRQLMSTVRETSRREGPPSRTLIDPTTGELIPVKPIEIPLITIEPLPGAEGRSGGRQ